MKNIHFCTPELLRRLKGKSPWIVTFRTGWINAWYTGDVVNLNERDPDGKNTLICKGRIMSVKARQYQNLDFGCDEEIDRYGKKFHPEHIFIRYRIKKLKVLEL